MLIYSVKIFLFEWLGMSESGWGDVGWHASSSPDSRRVDRELCTPWFSDVAVL